MILAFRTAMGFSLSYVSSLAASINSERLYIGTLKALLPAFDCMGAVAADMMGRCDSQ